MNKKKYDYSLLYSKPKNKQSFWKHKTISIEQMLKRGLSNHPKYNGFCNPDNSCYCSESIKSEKIKPLLSNCNNIEDKFKNCHPARYTGEVCDYDYSHVSGIIIHVLEEHSFEKFVNKKRNCECTSGYSYGYKLYNFLACDNIHAVDCVVSYKKLIRAVDVHKKGLAGRIKNF